MTLPHYEIRIAETGDEPQVTSLLFTVISEFRTKGIAMWQNGYPSRDNIVEDISSGSSYVAVSKGKAVGFMFVRYGPEDFHETLKGEWGDANCSVMHRLLTDPSTRGTGLGSLLIGYWESLSREHGCSSMRTETDETNRPMRRLMSRCGFREAGVLTFDNSDKIGFEKILDINGLIRGGR